MKEARRKSIWHRASPAAAACAALLMAAFVQACDGGPQGDPSSSSSGGDGGHAGSAGTAGSGGGGAGTPGTPQTTQCTQDSASVTQPLDATPSPDGETIYFTGVNVDDV